jgi:cytochrome oxidase Cu insertion factor (SCO1/SenC/PrrC family)
MSSKIVGFLATLALAVTAGAILILTGVIDLGPVAKKTRSMVIAGAPTIGGAFNLVTHEGKAVTDKDFIGKHMLVFFGYTSCPDVCPTEMNTISLAFNQMGSKADKVVPIFISVDPARDSTEIMAEFVAAFDAPIVGLTGSQEQVDKVVKAYKVYAKKVENDDPEFYLMDHTSYTYLMDDKGELSEVFAYGTSPEKIAKTILEKL